MTDVRFAVNTHRGWFRDTVTATINPGPPIGPLTRRWHLHRDQSDAFRARLVAAFIDLGADDIIDTYPPSWDRTR